MSINKVILIGNVGKDPEVRYLDSGVVVANLTLATTERGYTATNGTVVPDRTDWHNIVLWRGLAEVAEKYVKKGSKLYIEGKIRTRTYDDTAGNKRYVTEIYGDNMELLDKKPEVPQAPAGSSAEPKPSVATAAPQTSSPPLEETKDDLPF
ncbi:MAG: single-stranded DNA-binding protein [Dysgonamonadaceae bacterium]|jgi:single-strand DNA-binding protein|nr:single-stranded DNA-binding protein [Dysgonamonadaceae bacterium]